ncbi:MAG: hypothetical protein K5886_02770 [Lachnospiraceae bacterium]|nr:hypothetical protein [Lachnospiraceae bacterium]
MRCALSYDKNKDLIDQKLSAWGEMQSLEEDPAYKEEDIKDEKEREYFLGYKMACDEICKDIDNIVEDEMMSEEASDHLQALMAGSIAMQLFSILDNQEE